MVRTKQTVRTSTGPNTTRQQLAPGAARSPPGAGPSRVSSTTEATVNGSKQKQKRKRGADDAEEKRGTSTVKKSSESNVENPPDEWSNKEVKLLLGAQIALCELHVEEFMEYPALRVRGRRSVLKKLKEIHAQVVEACEVEALQGDRISN